MNMKDRLKMMDEIRTLNAQRDAAHAKDEKLRLRWVITYSFVDADGSPNYDYGLNIKGESITEALDIAHNMLIAIAQSYGWKQWAVHMAMLLDTRGMLLDAFSTDEAKGSVLT